MGDSVMLWVRGEHPANCSVEGLADYKFYCFHGEPRFLYVSQGLENHSTAKISFLSFDWEFMPFRREDYAPFKFFAHKPGSFDEMQCLARVLATDIPFVRVDFYEQCSKALFSEVTFSPCSGLMPFTPKEYDVEVGSMLDIAFIGAN